ncbi:hypothetical protein AVEN_110112-1 [Araneus ventricosus]|uniref:Uncharacterized protein n=1 Tax=Araneus ventricosus TaxID=182803 RepID=A0A4Y2NMV0_ARAVE|nr:hypothetical protein AVEN_110112-1 [Araneus ventricosus]
MTLAPSWANPSLYQIWSSINFIKEGYFRNPCPDDTLNSLKCSAFAHCAGMFEEGGRRKIRNVLEALRGCLKRMVLLLLRNASFVEDGEPLH